MRKLVFALATVLLFGSLLVAQQVNTFSFTSNVVALPGGKSTIAATEAGATLTITPNFDLLSTNIIGSGNTFNYFGGGFNYRLPVLSTKLDNHSPNLNGMRFQFYLTASAGVDRISQDGVEARQHYAFTGGGGVNYDLTGSGTWALGGRVQYAKFPGYANNTYIVEFGPSLHF